MDRMSHRPQEAGLSGRHILMLAQYGPKAKLLADQAENIDEFAGNDQEIMPLNPFNLPRHGDGPMGDGHIIAGMRRRGGTCRQAMRGDAGDLDGVGVLPDRHHGIKFNIHTRQGDRDIGHDIAHLRM